MSVDKKAVRAKEQELLSLTSSFCRAQVHDEYDELCRKLISKMARKREVPFLSGRLEIWAAAVIYAIGSINFLFDKATLPFVSHDAVAEYFKVSKSTASQKAKRIRDMFKMSPFCTPEFSTQHMNENNPLARLAMVNGFILTLDG